MARLEIRILKKEKDGSLRPQIELLETEVDGHPVPARQEADSYVYVFEGEPGLHTVRLWEPNLAGSALTSLLLCLMVFTDGIRRMSPFTCRYAGEVQVTEDAVLAAVLEGVPDAKGCPTGVNRLSVRAENAELRRMEQACTASKADIRRWVTAALLPPEILDACLMAVGILAGISAYDATGPAGALLCWLFAFLCMLFLFWYPYDLFKKCRQPDVAYSDLSI